MVQPAAPRVRRGERGGLRGEVHTDPEGSRNSANTARSRQPVPVPRSSTVPTCEGRGKPARAASTRVSVSGRGISAVRDTARSRVQNPRRPTICASGSRIGAAPDQAFVFSRVQPGARSRSSASGVRPRAWASSSRASRRGCSIPAARERLGRVLQGGRAGTNGGPRRCVAHEHEPENDTPGGPSNLEKDPDDWTTGDEPMTGAQASDLKTLCEEAGEAFEDGLTKAEASKRIDALREKTGKTKNRAGRARPGRLLTLRPPAWPPDPRRSARR